MTHRRLVRSEIAAALSGCMALALACGGGDDGSDGSDGDGGSDIDGGPDGSPPDAAPPDGSRPDGGADASPFACDPVAQTGCGEGEKCDIAQSGTFGCVPAGITGEFERCEPVQPNECVAGFSCRDTNFEDHRCARLCDEDDPDACRAGETCESVRRTSDGLEYRMCSGPNECQPFRQDCIDPAEACMFTVGGAFCFVPDPQPLPDGSPCDDPAECEVGSACLDTGPVDRCVRLCEPTDGKPGCAEGVVCTPLAQIGAWAIGACGL